MQLSVKGVVGQLTASAWSCRPIRKSSRTPLPPTITKAEIVAVARLDAMVFAPISGVGDIKVAADLIRNVVKALDKTRGAAAEYRSNKEKLWHLSRLLLDVEASCNKPDETSFSSSTDVALQDLTAQCRLRVDEFLMGIRKFEPSLGSDRPGHKCRDVSKKLRWQFTCSKRMSNFWDEIRGDLISLSILMAVVYEHDRRSDIAKINEKLEEIKDQIEKSAAGQHVLISVFKETICDAKEQIILTLTQLAPVQAFNALSSQITSFMKCIFASSIASYRIILDIQGRLPSHLERGMHPKHFVLEDAHGRIKSVDMDCIDSWPAFHNWLEFRFKDRAGLLEVQRRAFVLHNSESNRDITDDVAWEKAFISMQRVVMCIRVNGIYAHSECPQCSSPTKFEDADHQCAECGLWYRHESKPFRYTSRNLRTALTDQLGVPAYDAWSFGPKTNIASFKRVRLVHQQFVLDNEAQFFENEALAFRKLKASLTAASKSGDGGFELQFKPTSSHAVTAEPISQIQRDEAESTRTPTRKDVTVDDTIRQAEVLARASGEVQERLRRVWTYRREVEEECRYHS